MKLSVLTFLLVIPSITSIEVPERFLRRPHGDTPERELFRRSRCEVKDAWEVDIQRVHDSAEDPEVERIAAAALDIFEESKALEIPSSLPAIDEEDTAAIQKSLAEFDAPAVRSDLNRIGRQISSGMLFGSPEQRVENFDKASQELSSTVARTFGLLQGLLLVKEEAVTRIVVLLWRILELVQAVLLLVLADIPLLLLRLLGRDGKDYEEKILNLVDVLFFFPLSTVLLTAAALIFAIIDFLISLTGGRGAIANEFRMDCAIARVMRKLPPTVMSVARSQVKVAELEAEP